MLYDNIVVVIIMLLLVITMYHITSCIMYVYVSYSLTSYHFDWILDIRYWLLLSSYCTVIYVFYVKLSCVKWCAVVVVVDKV